MISAQLGAHVIKTGVSPVLIDLKPTGSHYMQDFHAAGGMSALLCELKDLLHLDCMTVTGKTLGENIADVAGLQAALDAYHASLGGKPAPFIDGLTGDPPFFIAFEQSWAEKTREDALRQQIATNGHAPGQYRALTVRNLDAWYAAFNVKPGDKLYLAPDKRVKVWG